MGWIKLFDSVEKGQTAVPKQTIRLLKIGDKKICLINHNNNFFAIDDKCPHMGASLSEGKLNYLGEVICPLHEYRFDGHTGRECASKCADAVFYKVKSVEKGIFIELLL